MSRREYKLEIIINGQSIEKVIIDSHYEAKHRDTINDELILELVKLLHGKRHEPQKEENGFKYFASDHLKLKGRLYKLVWLLEGDQLYVGVVNAYRR